MSRNSDGNALCILVSLVLFMGGCGTTVKAPPGVLPTTVEEAAQRWGLAVVGGKGFTEHLEGISQHGDTAVVEWEVEPGPGRRVLSLVTLGLFWEPGDEITAWISPSREGGTEIRVRCLKFVQLFWVFPIIWSDCDRAGQIASMLLRYAEELNSGERH